MRILQNFCRYMEIQSNRKDYFAGEKCSHDWALYYFKDTEQFVFKKTLYITVTLGGTPSVKF